jgi:hypothetical protein
MMQIERARLPGKSARLLKTQLNIKVKLLPDIQDR